MNLKIAAVTLAEDDLALAQKLHDQVMSTGVIQPGKNPTGVETADAYLKGYIGELAYKRLLEEHAIDFTWEPRTDGRSDSGPDFVLLLPDKQVTVDVKTAGEPSHTKLMVPTQQHQRKEGIVERYVAARWLRPEPVVEFHGSISWTTFERVAYAGEFGQGPTRWVPLSRLPGPALPST